MDKEKIFKNLEQRYVSKREMTSRIPLGTDTEQVWSELLNRRKSRAKILPLGNHQGAPYWYVTTPKMVAASEKIIEALYDLDTENTEFDPYLSVQNICTLEESFYTSYVEGSSMTMQDAMAFIQSESPPRDMEEQLIVNNRNAGSYAASNLYRGIDEPFLRELAFILTDGLDEGGQGFRTEDRAEIPSMQGETYEVPAACVLPDRTRELVTYLADPAVHPLIKASVAQAWILTVRPFIDGNERLGRVISMIILVRAGYFFFGEVSISSLIARRSYAYFEAVANTLRSENGADLTYFIEYYIELLARAVEERKLKKLMKQEQDHHAEMEMAKTPLAPSPPTVINEPGPPSFSEVSNGDIPGGETFPKDGDIYNEALAEENDDREEHLKKVTLLIRQWADSERSKFNLQEVKDELGIPENWAAYALHVLENNGAIKTVLRKQLCRSYIILWSSQEFYVKQLDVKDPVECLKSTLAIDPSDIKSAFCRQLIRYVVAGITFFRLDEMAKQTGYTGSQLSKFIYVLSLGNVIDLDRRDHDSPIAKYVNVYRIYISKRDVYASKLYEYLYDQEVISSIGSLRESDYSPRDNRIGDMLRRCLPKGELTYQDYERMGVETCWAKDMNLIARMGLVEMIGQDRYRIRYKIRRETELTHAQKTRLTELYKNFGFNDFSREMVIAKLDCPLKKVGASLHEFTLLRILECTDDERQQYRIMVTPEQNPEYFDIAG